MPMKRDWGKDVPNPGSDEAVAKGCVCAVLDNHHGEGFMWGGEGQCFWVNEDRSLHGGRRKK